LTSADRTYTDDELINWADELTAEIARDARRAGAHVESWRDGPNYGVTCKTCRQDPVAFDRNKLPQIARGLTDVNWRPHSARNGTCNPLTCEPRYDEHANYTDTGRRGTNPDTGNRFEVWACHCGKKTMEVLPHLLPGAQGDHELTLDERSNLVWDLLKQWIANAQREHPGLDVEAIPHGRTWVITCHSCTAELVHVDLTKVRRDLSGYDAPDWSPHANRACSPRTY
jgi:hypothetical protein